MGAKWALDAFQPDMHLSSHIHETEGLEDNVGPTKIFSVGRHGKIIEL
jgi:Icc-related predicted phosphoesterase